MRQTPGIDAQAIVEEIMTMHWKPGGCKCWICTEGRGIGLRRRNCYMPHLRTTPERGYVHVDPSPNHLGSWARPLY